MGKALYDNQTWSKNEGDELDDIYLSSRVPGFPQVLYYSLNFQK